MFTDALKLTLALTIGGTTLKIPGANVKSLETDIHPYGFTAGLSFWVSSEKGRDPLFSKFVTQDLIKVKLDIEPNLKPVKAKIDPLTLQGFVTGKALLSELTIENIHLKADPVLYRHYRISFADPASVLWRQHFPCDLMVEEDVKELIDANKASGVTLQYDWGMLNNKYAINTLSPGAPDAGSSFYDFIVWFAATHNGVFRYDGQTNSYTLSGTKGQQGDEMAMSELEVADHQIDFPETFRYDDQFLNVLAEDPQKSKTNRSAAVNDLRRDVLLRLPIASDFETAFKLESKKQKSRKHGITLTHRRFPLMTYRPGVVVKFEGGLWSKKIFLQGKKYRVKDIFLKANAANDAPDADHNMPYTHYNMDLFSELELKEDKALNLPPFKAPSYPIYVEGKIVSEQGEEKEDTYQIYEQPKFKIDIPFVDDETQAEVDQYTEKIPLGDKEGQAEKDHYRVKIPIFEDKQVVCPFEPLFAPGHFYFPAYRDARVLVALDFHSARIVQFLDWRAGGRLPMDTQGNHILFGKSGDSSTSISHIYVDKKPQLNMKRFSSKDTEIIQLQEGTIILQTKDESSS